jgi:hypothetical protein
MKLEDLQIGMRIRWRFQKCRGASFETCGVILSIDPGQCPPLPPLLVSDETGHVKEWRVFLNEVIEIVP